ncbi:MAG: hypothetical protein ACRDTF_24845 [Pseudonocardiaceae bacterium]
MSAEGRQVGALGLLSNKARRAAGIQTQVGCFELDVDRRSWVPQDHRAVTLRVILRSATSTLTADEIAVTRQAVLDALAARHGARLREV